jgi:hypothetical protein
MTRKHSDKIELIVVFKKDIELEKAEDILNNAGANHRQGMDSSRGKLYFYSTGPKFILTFEAEQHREKFASDYENLPEIHEIYTPDWTKCKD